MMQKENGVVGGSWLILHITSDKNVYISFKILLNLLSNVDIHFTSGDIITVCVLNIIPVNSFRTALLMRNEWKIIRFID
jgi:hypothetical protein